MAAGLKEIRKVVSAMSEEEQKEAVKAIDSEILAQEVYSRLIFSEQLNTAHKQLDRCQR